MVRFRIGGKLFVFRAISTWAALFIFIFITMVLFVFLDSSPSSTINEERPHNNDGVNLFL